MLSIVACIDIIVIIYSGIETLKDYISVLLLHEALENVLHHKSWKRFYYANVVHATRRNLYDLAMHQGFYQLRHHTKIINAIILRWKQRRRRIESIMSQSWVFILTAYRIHVIIWLRIEVKALSAVACYIYTINYKIIITSIWRRVAIATTHKWIRIAVDWVFREYDFFKAFSSSSATIWSSLWFFYKLT